MDSVQIRAKRHHAAAVLPQVLQAGDVAADLCACEAQVIPKRGRARVETGWAFEFPEGFRGRIQSRSGLSLQSGIEAGAGLIDQGYRHPVSVLLYNHSDEDFMVHGGDRIAQLCVERYTHPSFEEVDAIDLTARTAGWGSSGTGAPTLSGGDP